MHTHGVMQCAICYRGMSTFTNWSTFVQRTYYNYAYIFPLCMFTPLSNSPFACHTPSSACMVWYIYSKPFAIVECALLQTESTFMITYLIIHACTNVEWSQCSSGYQGMSKWLWYKNLRTIHSCGELSVSTHTEEYPAWASQHHAPPMLQAGPCRAAPQGTQTFSPSSIL